MVRFRSVRMVLVATLLLQGCTTRASDGGRGNEPDQASRLTSQGVDHPYAEVLKQYIRGCNTGDTTLLMSTFTEDIAVYFLDNPPVKGRQAVAKLWSDYHNATHTRWTIDRMVVQGDEAVFEWSSLGELPGGAGQLFTRGVDWYVFRDGRIAEIRQYYDVRNPSPPDKPYEQQGFPYKERGYPVREDIDARLP